MSLGVAATLSRRLWLRATAALTFVFPSHLSQYHSPDACGENRDHRNSKGNKPGGKSA